MISRGTICSPAPCCAGSRSCPIAASSRPTHALVVRTWNPWLEAQTGVPASVAVGASLIELYPTIKDRGLDRYYANALAGEVHVLSERFHRFLIPMPRNIQSIGLSEMAQSARIAPLTVGATVVGTITVIEDVTERVVSERELRNQIAASERARNVAEEASRLKDEFLATMSHEIRTPLNAVLGWTRILRTQPRLKTRDHALEVIERNAASQLRLVEDLLDMARVISGKLRLELKTIALEDVVRAAIDVVTPGAAAKNITISTSFDERRPAINGDFDRLQQAVWNLMSNAVKFTEPGGRVDVQIAASEAMVELTVRDTGQGIARDFLPYLFDRFRQADASASRRHGGLGLGLALVRQIVELHGGSVTASSAGTNRGSAFVVRLPIASASDGRAGAARRAGDVERHSRSDRGRQRRRPRDAEDRAARLRRHRARGRRRRRGHGRSSKAHAPPTCSSPTSACPTRMDTTSFAA